MVNGKKNGTINHTQYDTSYVSMTSDIKMQSQTFLEEFWEYGVFKKVSLKMMWYSLNMTKAISWNAYT